MHFKMYDSKNMLEVYKNKNLRPPFQVYKIQENPNVTQVEKVVTGC